MDQAEAIDLSFIPKTITAINEALHKAAIANKLGDAKTERKELLLAGAQARVALTDLHDHPLWDGLRREQQRFRQQWQDLGLPVAAKLLVALGCKPPESARDLIDLGNRTLDRAVGVTDPDIEDPITQAQFAISALDALLGELMASMQHSDKLRAALGTACKVLATTLVAAILDPAVRELIQQAGEPAAGLLRELLRHAGDALPSLSMAFVVGLVKEATRYDPDDDRPRGAPYDDRPRGLPYEETPVRRTTVDDSEPRWIDSSRSMNDRPSPATERAPKDRSGPDDLAGGRASS
jgi:hypothetical protein